jgi:hypothetical protein
MPTRRKGRNERRKLNALAQARDARIQAALSLPKPRRAMYGAPTGLAPTSTDHIDRLQGNACTRGFHGPMGGITKGGSVRAKRTGRGGNRLIPVRPYQRPQYSSDGWDKALEGVSLVYEMRGSTSAGFSVPMASDD